MRKILTAAVVSVVLAAVPGVAFAAQRHHHPPHGSAGVHHHGPGSQGGGGHGPGGQGGQGGQAGPGAQGGPAGRHHRPGADGSGQGSSNHKTHPVRYAVRGTLTAYTPASGTPTQLSGSAQTTPPATSTPGSISLTLGGHKEDNATLTQTALTFVTEPSTWIIPRKATLSVGDRVVVMVQAPRHTKLTALGGLTAIEVIDQSARMKKHPTVTYVLRGPLTAYTPAGGTPTQLSGSAQTTPPTTSTPGSVALTVRGANFDGARKLRGDKLTFVTDSSTKVVAPKGTSGTNDWVIVKVRAPKGSTVTALEALTPFEVIIHPRHQR